MVLSKGKYLYLCRNRTYNPEYYYKTILRGNQIRTYRTVHLNKAGKSVNAFMSWAVGWAVGGEADEFDIVETQTILLLASPINKPEEHIARLKELSPDLKWYELPEMEVLDEQAQTASCKAERT